LKLSDCAPASAGHTRSASAPTKARACFFMMTLSDFSDALLAIKHAIADSRFQLAISN
jgi:hypothetical protein